MIEKTGDITLDIDPMKKTVILHGCNCHHVMGAGLAKHLREMWPKVYSSDKMYSKRSDKTKLGTFTVADINSNLHILNCYTQYDYKSYTKEVLLDYDALERCLSRVKLQYEGWTIRIPKIGCGLAGGEWHKVKSIILRVLNDSDIELYI